jgi:uroporphyrinogen-III synthase
MKYSFAIVLAAFSIATVSPSGAQEQQSFKSLMGRGFDIRSVTFARGESTDNRETFIVTLQKEKTVAVCFFSSNAWINLAPNVLDDSKRCEVR